MGKSVLCKSSGFVRYWLPKLSHANKTGFALLLLFFSQFSFGQVTADFSASTTQGCSPLVVCFTNLSTGNPTSQLWNFGNGNMSPDPNPCAIYIIPGTYTVSLTVNNGGSSDTKTMTNLITVFQNPTAGLSADKTLGCAPSTINFTDLSAPGDAPITSWQWDFGDGNTSTQQHPTTTYTNPGLYSVILLVRDANGCTNEYNANNLITILPTPQANFSAAPTFSCSYPATISFTNLSSTSSSIDYLWDFGDGNTSTQQNPNHTYNIPGLYTVSLTITDAAGCSDTETKVDFLSIDDLQADFAPDKTSGCWSVNVNFTDLSSTAGTITSWHWDFGDGGTSNLQNVWHNFSGIGTYTVSLTVTNDKGCTDTIVYPDLITVNPGPSANFSADQTQGCTLPFQVNFTDNSTGAIAWDWDFGDGNTSTAQNPTHTYTALGSYPVELTITSADGCTNTRFMPDYIEISAPNANFQADVTNGCVDLTVNFSDISTSVEPITGWFWDFGDGNFSTLQDPTNVYTAHGEYDVMLVITNSAGCQDTLIVPQYIAAGDTPVANFGAPITQGCLFDPIAFFDSSNVGDEWYWDFGDGGSSLVQDPNHQYGDTGTFTVTLIVLNFGCADTFIRENYITISPPQANFTVTNNCLNPYEVIFTDASIAPDLWFWHFGDGDTSNTPNNVHTYDSIGVYSVSLYVQDTAAGCYDSLTLSVTVTDPVAEFTGTPLSGCSPLVVSFTSQSVDASFYSWDFGDGGTSTQQNPIYTYHTAGTYDVTLIITDLHGCDDTITKSNYVTVYDVFASFRADTLIGCSPLYVNYTDSSYSYLGVVNSWSWQFGDGDTSTQQNPSNIYDLPGTYSVQLIVTDTNGCVDTMLRVDYIVPTYPTPGFEADDTLACIGQGIIFSNFSIGSDMSYLWDFGDGTTSTDTTPVHAYSAIGEYTVTLTATDVNGCDSTIVKPLYIKVIQPTAGLDVDTTFASCPPLWVNFTDLSDASDSITNWLWHFGDNQTSDLQHPSHVYITPDTFWVHLEVTDYNGCRDTAYFPDPIIVAGPRGTFDFIQDEYCIDVPVQFFSDAVDSVIHIYDFADGNVGVYLGGDTITYNYTYTGTFHPSLILDDGHGCVISIDHPDSITTFTINVGFTSDITHVCKSSMVQFFDLSTGVPNPSSWFWDFGDGNSDTVQNPAHYYSVAGTYDVTLVVTNLIGCTDTLIIPEYITVDPGPTAAFTSDSVSCVPLIVDFTDLSLSDSVIVSWSWDFGDGNTSILQNPANTYDSAGVFTVTLIIETVAGCFDTTTNPITVHPNPTAEAGPDQYICFGDSVQLSGSGGITFLWTPGVTLNDPTIADPVAYPTVSTTYSLMVTDSNGCTDTDSVRIIIHPLPIPNTTDTAICIGESMQLNVTGGVSYVWSPDSTLSDLNIANPVATPVSTTHYNVTVTDSNGCVNNTGMVLTVHPLPTPDILAAKTNLCVGESIQLTATGGIQYSWSPTAGLSNPNIPNPVATPVSSITYTVLVTDSNGCQNLDSISFVVNPMPTTTISPDVTICIYDTTQLEATGGISYNWYPDSSLSCSTCDNPYAFPVSDTKYYVDITNSFGCTVTDSVTVTVEPLPVITIANGTDICNGNSYQLNASGGVSYNWAPSGTLSCSNCPNPLATPDSTTTYIVEVTSAFGCINYDSVEIIVYQYRSKMTISDSVTCVPATIEFTDNSYADGYITSRTWDFGDGNTASGLNPQNTYAIADTYFVKLIIETSNGCIDSISKPVIINPLPVAEAGPDTAICLGDTIQLNATGGVDYLWTPNHGISNATIANPMVFPDTTTLYQLLVTDMNGCQDTDSIKIIINPLPLVTVTAADTICQYSPIQLTATGGISYSWSPAQGLNNPDIANPIATPMLNRTYTVLVTDSNGCQNTGSTKIDVNPSPVVTISPDTTICHGAAVPLKVTGGSSYIWSPDSSLSCNDCDTPIAVPTETTNYEVVVINGYGCETIRNILITVEPLPIIVASSDTFICDGENLQLEVSYEPTYNYSWTPVAELNNPDIANPVVTPTANTTYVVEVTTAFGCVDYDTVDITVWKFNTKMGLSDTTACVPVEVQFNDYSLATDSVVSWNWNFGDGNTSFIKDPLHTFTDSGSFEVKLILTSLRGCTDSVTGQIIVNGLPHADAGPDSTICLGESVQLLAFGGGTYHWLPATGLSSNTISNPVAQPDVTTYYRLVVTDSNGCRDIDSLGIIVNPLPVSTISAGATLCFGDSAQLSATGGTAYNWTPVTGLSDPEVFNPKASPSATTIYKVDITNTFECTVSDSVLVVINPVPDLQVKALNSVCQGESVQIEVSGAVSYEWSPSDYLSCATCPNPVAQPDTTINYILRMLDNYNCEWFDTIPIIVSPLPTIKTIEDRMFCAGEEIELTSESTNATSFNWTPASYLNNASLLSPVSVPETSIEYTVTAFSQDGCIAQDVVALTLIDQVGSSMEGNHAICYGESLELNAEINISSGSGVEVIWLPAESFADPTLLNQTVTPESAVTYTMIAYSSTCVPDTQMINIYVNDLPSVDAGEDQVVLTGTQVTLTASSDDEIEVYTWTPEGGLDCSNCQTVHLTANETVTYYVDVLDINGCPARDSVRIRVAENCNGDIFVPNAFTPNGDEVNDVLLVRSTGLIEMHIFRIFDRWGNLVFETKDQNEGWNGIHKGKFVNTDVYVYYVRATCPNGQVVEKKGNVTAIR